MCKRVRQVLGVASVVLWLAAAVVTAVALRGGEHADEWHLIQLPLLVLGGCCGLLAVLGQMIAPAKELWRLGYDAGLRDGARAMMSDEVVEIRPRVRAEVD